MSPEALTDKLRAALTTLHVRPRGRPMVVWDEPVFTEDAMVIRVHWAENEAHRRRFASVVRSLGCTAAFTDAHTLRVGFP